VVVNSLGWGAFVIFSLQGKEGGAGKQKRGQRNRYPLKMGIKKGTLSLIGQCAGNKKGDSAIAIP